MDFHFVRSCWPGKTIRRSVRKKKLAGTMDAAHGRTAWQEAGRRRKKQPAVARKARRA